MRIRHETYQFMTDLLAHGPNITAAQFATTTGRTTKTCVIQLQRIFKYGFAHRAAGPRRTSVGQRGGRAPYVYTISDLGMMVLARKQQAYVSTQKALPKLEPRTVRRVPNSVFDLASTL